MRAAARRCGFVELESPSVESLEIYRVKSGEELSTQLWTFRDKGGREVALAPETTPSLARLYVERAKAEPLPSKWFTISRLWRYEEPQAGRTREFTQFNLDILGVPGVEGDAEVLAAASRVLDEAGARGLYAFRVSDRALAEGLGRRSGARDTTTFFRLLDRYRKMRPKEFEEDLQAAGARADGVSELTTYLARVGAGVPAEKVDAYLAELAPLALGEEAQEGVARIGELFRLARELGIADRLVFDPTVVRGLAYYTSTVFEAYDREGDLRALFGGGRYDHLVELFGGPPTPACGVAIGDQTLEILLKRHGRWPEGEPPLDTYVVAVTPELAGEARILVQKLREAGISADSDLLARSLSRQLKEAGRRRARRALLLGPNEKAKGVIVERDLTTGSQRELSPDAALRPA